MDSVDGERCGCCESLNCWFSLYANERMKSAMMASTGTTSWTVVDRRDTRATAQFFFSRIHVCRPVRVAHATLLSLTPRGDSGTDDAYRDDVSAMLVLLSPRFLLLLLLASAYVYVYVLWPVLVLSDMRGLASSTTCSGAMRIGVLDNTF